MGFIFSNVVDEGNENHKKKNSDKNLEEIETRKKIKVPLKKLKFFVK